MAGRIFLANVGVNASHRFSSPLFPDGTFEFIPTPEDRDLPAPHAIRYTDLKSFYDQGQSLTKYIPKRLWGKTTHNDPEFDTYTYGDNCEVNPRASSLKRMESGDFLFFLARLDRWENDKPTNNHGFHLVGFLEIQDTLKDVRRLPDASLMPRFGHNAHIRRGLSDSELWDRFWVFAGSESSVRFHRAIPVNRELCNQVFVSADGSPWSWDGGRSDLQIIGSYTRSCRCVIDPGLPAHAERAKIFWNWISQYS